MRHQRGILGPADVSDEELADIVATLLHESPDHVTVLDSVAEEVDYDLSTITTAGRYWVSGTALVGDRRQPFRLFVKHVQSWGRSPQFAVVPKEIAAMAEAAIPWRTEPLVYRSDLADRLPDGLRMPRALRVCDLDEASASIWMETITPLSTPWDITRFAKAARLLGRLAASERVRERAAVGQFDWTVRDYLSTRLTHQVIPMVLDDELWHHPLFAGAFDDELRIRLQEAARRAGDIVDELSRLPLGTGHGDASPNNLLVTDEDNGFVLIDYGTWNEAPIGFDLGQLLVGDVQIGRRAASLLSETEEAILPAYVAGLMDEGYELDIAVVRRAHALHLLLFTGLSTPPFDYLDATPSPALLHIAREIARFLS